LLSWLARETATSLEALEALLLLEGEPKMQINSISDFRRAMRVGPYAWPGGYPLYFTTLDGAALSFASAKAERRNILEALRDNDKSSGWRVCNLDINYEDAELICDHSGETIESAYGDAA
jgi:hypothetical protein